MGIGGDDLPMAVTLYYDPLLDVHHRLPAFTGLINTLYLAPQVPADAQRVFEAAATQLGLLEGDGPLLAGTHRSTAIAWIVTRDWGMHDLADRIRAGCEKSYEPTWDGDEFWWGLELDEPHPRGQFNALLAAAEATSEGAWTALANRHEPYRGPEVHDVDLNAAAVRQAVFDEGRLLLAFSVATATTARVTGFDTTSVDVEGVDRFRAEGGDLVLELGPGDVRVVVRGSLTSSV